MTCLGVKGCHIPQGGGGDFPPQLVAKLHLATQVCIDTQILFKEGRYYHIETKLKKSSLRKKTFFSNMVCLGGVFAPA
jgi:hypothetical protein